MARRIYPNWLVLWPMQTYSRRAWVYRKDQGWIFDELTPDERAEFKSYQRGITIARMRIRLPYSQPWGFYGREPQKSSMTHWFASCMTHRPHPLAFSTFQFRQRTGHEPEQETWSSVKPGTYETWLWNDEVTWCQERGWNLTVHHGWEWKDWGVPPEWKSPLTGPPRHPRPRSAEYTCIYALVDEFTQEVGYVGRSDHPERRFLDHLKDTNNPAKQAWIQSLLGQGRQPKLMVLEQVPVAEEGKREHYWISYYQQHGHNLTNDICQRRSTSVDIKAQFNEPGPLITEVQTPAHE
jgi:GIY-YIG catalytic domain-containing protein